MASAGKNAKIAAGGSKKDTDKPKRFTNNPFIYFGTIAILIIVIIAFVIFPTSSAGAASNRLVFGYYAGKPIEHIQGGYFAKAASSINERMKQQGYDQSNYQMYAYQVWRGAFEQTATHLAIMEEAKKLGITVTDKKIDDIMTGYAGFQENGRFSVQKYRDTDASALVQLRKDFREDTITQSFMNDIYGVKTSTKELDFVKQIPVKERSIAYAAFPFSSFPDSEIKAFGEANKGLFRKIKLSRITIVKSEAEANKVLGRVKKDPGSFAAVAKSESKDSYAVTNGEYGWKFVYDLRNDLEKKEDVEKFLELKKGEFSPVIKASSEGWIFFRVEEAVLEPNFTQPDAISAVKTYLEDYEKGKIEDYFLKQAAEFKTAAAKNFDLACTKFHVNKQVVDSFPLNYGDMLLFKQINSQNLPELAGASTNEKFLVSVFSLPVEGISEPFVMSESVLVFKVLEEKNADPSVTNMIDMYYSYLQQQFADQEFRKLILESPELKDNFSDVFFKYVMPSESPK